MEFNFENLNTSSIGLSKAILENGVARKTRGYDCVEFPEPVLIHIHNPCDRYINIKERKNHKVLPFAESLALATGVNNMELYAGYVPSMMGYSDDGEYQRAGYGPRMRAFTGFGGGYKVDNPFTRHIYSGEAKVVDQLKFVIDTLNKDINSRQAIITIHDPAKDCFNKNGQLLETKDQPCSRSLQFMMVNGKLDATLYIRSNDMIFGYMAVNMFNFTFVQEYVANILGVEIGVYHHFANNLHYYDDKTELVKTMAGLNPDDYKSEFGIWQYPNQFNSLSMFDDNVNDVFSFERGLRLKKGAVDLYNPNDFPDFFGDWLRVFKQYWAKEKQEYINPYLTKLFS